MRSVSLSEEKDGGHEDVIPTPPFATNCHMPPPMVETTAEKFGSIYGFSSEYLASMLSPEAVLCDQTYSVTVDDIHFLGYPVMLPRRSSQAEDTHIQMLHLCFLLQARAPPAVKDAYLRLIRQLTGALVHEELRCGFASEQVEILLEIRDRQHPPIVMAAEAMTSLMVQRSMLAQHVQHVYTSLTQPARRQATLHVGINQWITVAWCAVGHDATSLRRIEGTLRPYHTLLMSSEAAQAALPRDCSPALYRLAMHANPLKSFAEIAEDIDTPLAHVYRLAAHLAYWQKATIIHKLSKASIYMVSPSANLDVRGSAAAGFAREFPKHNYHEVLESFSHGRPLGDVLHGLSPYQTRDHINMLIWLLRRRLLVELHTYLYLNVPCPPNEQISTEANAPLQDWEYVAIQARGGCGEGVQQLKRLAPYMRGNNHIADIMWRENMPRKDIMNVIAQYHDIILTSLEEEGATYCIT